MQVGLEFGTLLDRFLADFGAKLGGKLDPRHQNPENWGTKTMLKNHQTSGHATRTKCADCLVP